MTLRTVLLSLIMLFVGSGNVAHAVTGLTFHGRILQSNNTPVQSANVLFRLQIRSPGVENCLLYQEEHTRNMTGTNGVFVLTIGQGTRAAAVVDGGNSLAKVFANRGTISGPLTCDSGDTTYTTAAGEGRRLDVEFSDNGGPWQTLPPQNINYSPLAIEAVQVGGYGQDQLLRVEDGASTSEFTAANLSALWDLITGNSSLYMKNDGSGFAPTAAVDFGGQKIIDLADPTLIQDAATKGYVDGRLLGSTLAAPAAGQVGQSIRWKADGTGWEYYTPSTTDNTKLPLAGGIMSGGIDMGNNSIIGLAAPTAGGDAVNKTYADAISTAKVSKAGDTMTGLLLLSGDPSNAVGAATKQYVDAVSTAASGAYLRIDGTAGLSGNWDVNGTTAGGTALLTGLGTPSASDGAATKGYVDTAITGAGTSANTYADGVAATAEADAIAHANANLRGYALATPVGQQGRSIRWNSTNNGWEYFTPSTGDALVSGDLNQFAAGGTTSAELANQISDESGTGLLIYGTSPTLITPTIRAFTLGGSTSGGVTFQVASTGATGTYIWPSAAPASTMILQSDASGNLSWVSAGGGGDAFVANSLAQFAATTSAELRGVLNDETGSGLAVFGTSPTITTPSIGTGFTVNGSTNGSVTFNAPVSGAAGTYTLPSAVPGSNMVLQSNASGVLSWVADANSGGTVTGVSSANTDIDISGTAAAPILTLNSGTAASQIVKLNASAELPAVSGVNLTNLDASDLASGTVPNARLSSQVALAPTAPVAGDSGKSVRWNGTAWEFYTPTTGTGDAVTSGDLNQFAAGGTTSAELANQLSDESGTGLVVYNTNANLVTPTVRGFTLGGATSGGILMQVAATGAAGTYTWPNAAPGSNMVLQSNSSGVLSWVADANSGGTLTGVTSANTDIAVGGTATVPELTLNVGTGNNQIVKLNGSAELPAVSGVNLTNLDASDLASGTVPNARLSSQVPLAPTAPVAGDANKSIRWNGTAWEFYTPTTGTAMASGKLDQFAATSSAELATVISDETGTGLLVYGTSPTLVTPTIRAFTLGGATSGGATISIAATGATGSYIWPNAQPSGNRLLQSDASGNLTWVSAGGGGDAFVANSLAQFAATTSAELRGVLNDETGSGLAVFGTSPTLSSPILTTPAIGTGFTVNGSTNGSVTFNAPATGAAGTYTLPSAVPGSNMVLQSNASGVLSWVADANSGGTVTGVTSANTDIDISGTAAAPILTLNSGTAASQIVKLNASAELPAVSGVNLTSLNASNLGSGTVPNARLSSQVALAPTAPVAGDANKSVRWNGTAWEFYTPTTGTGDAVTSGDLNQFTAGGTTSAELANQLSDETGTGLVVYGTSPTLVTPTVRGFTLGGATSGGILMQVAATGAAGTYTWPNAAPGSNMVLQSNSSGVLSWVADANSGGTLTGITSANTDIAIGGTATVPELTLNVGTGNNQIVKLNGSAELPAVSGVNLTNLDASDLASGTVPNARLSSQVPLAPTAPVAGDANKSVRWNGTAWEFYTPTTGTAMASGKLDQFAATSSAELANVISDETGTGLLVYGTSPTIVTPTVRGFTLGGATSGGITMQVAATGAAGTYTWPSAVPGSSSLLQVDSSGNLTWVAAGGGGDAFVSGDLNQFAAGGTTSAELANQLSDESGTGLVVYNTNANLVTPTVRGFTLGGATSGGASISIAATGATGSYTWPSAAPGSNMVLQSNASGVLSWVADANSGGTITSVTSANTDIAVGGTATVPELTLNVGTGNNQIVKLNGSAELPAVSGVNLTNLDASDLASGTVPNARLSSQVPLAPTAPVAGDANKSVRWNGTAWEFYTPTTGTGDFLAAGTVAMTGNLRLNGNWLSNDGGSEGIRVDNSGNVGINAAPSATYALDVNAGSTANGGLRVSGSGVGGGHIFLNATNATSGNRFAASVFQNNGTNQWSAGIRQGDGMFHIFDEVNTTSRMIINNSGNVGIGNGVTAPNGKLDVRGSIVMSGSGSGYSGFRVPAAAGSTVYELPAGAPGTNGYLLSSNTSGVLTWVAPPVSSGGDLKSDGSIALAGNWDLNGATAGGTSLLTGLGTPVVGDGAVNKTYADGNWLGLPLTAPAAGQVGQSVRWNAGGTAWEYFTAGDLRANGSVALTSNWDVDGAGAGTRLITGLAVPSASDGAATKGYVDSEVSTASGLFLRKDGTVGLTADWDANGSGTAGGTIKITGLDAPTVGDGAVTKTYADGRLLGSALAAPGAGQVNQSIRWNAGNTAWEYYTPTSTVADDSLNFDKFSDALALDASTEITADGAEVLSVTNTGTGDSFVVRDVASDTTPFRIDASGAVSAGGSLSANSFAQDIGGGTNVFNAFSWFHSNSNTAYTSTSAAIDSPAGTVIRVNNTDATAGNSTAISLSSNGGNAMGYIGVVNPASGNTPAMVFGQKTGATAYAERMRIDTSGRVGIGTDTPNQLLTVNGPMSLAAAAAPSLTAGFGKIYVDSGDANKLKYMNPAGAIVDLSAAGTASIADDSLDFAKFIDAMTLDAVSTITAPSGQAYTLSVNNEGTGASFRVNDAASDTTPFIVDADGNVGIGTASPSDLLTIKADQNSETKMLISNQDTGASARTSLRFESSSTTAALGLYSVNHATTPSLFRILSNSTTGDMRFYLNGSDRLTLRPDGKFGIGTVDPNQLLTVEGPMSLRAQAAPTLTANYGKIYVDSGDANKLKYMNPAGAIVDLSAGGGSVNWAVPGTIGSTTPNTGAFTTLSAGATTITSNSANALAVGLNGATNPALQVDTSTASSSTGVQIKSAAAGAGVTVQAVSSGSNESLLLASKGTGTVELKVNNSQKFNIGNDSFSGTNLKHYTFSASAGSFATPSKFSYTGAADTTITASMEVNSVHFNSAQTRQHSTGTLALQRDFRVSPSIHSFVGASTLTDAAAFAVDGPSNGGANATITNSSAIYVPTSALTNVTNSYGLNVAASTGATNNYAAVFSGGNVGIGTASPNQLLTVNGPMSLAAAAAPSLTAGFGKIYVDSGDANKLKYMNPAGAIVDLSAGGGTIADDSLDFAKFADTMALDASTNINTGANILSITNDGSGNTLVLNDNGTSDTTPFVIDAAGKVGIGVAAPTGVLHVDGGTAAASTTGADITLKAQAGGSGGNFSGGNIFLTPGLGSGTGSAGIVYVDGTLTNAGNNRTWSMTNVNTNTTGSVAAGSFGLQQSATAATNAVQSAVNASAIYMGATNGAAGSSLIGIKASAEAAMGVTPNVIGGSFSATNSSAFASTVAVAKAAEFSVTATQPITTGYGVYVGSIGGATKYSVYASDSAAKSYFAGNVGIGTTDTNQLLTVNGPMSLAAAAAPTATTGFGKIYVDSGDSNKLKYMNPAGTIVDLSAGGGGTGDFLRNGTLAMTGNLRLGTNWLSNDGDSEGIAIDIDGDVGVGVASTGAKLYVYQATAGPDILKVESAGGNTTVDRWGSLSSSGNLSAGGNLFGSGGDLTLGGTSFVQRMSDAGNGYSRMLIGAGAKYDATNNVYDVSSNSLYDRAAIEFANTGAIKFISDSGDRSAAAQLTPATWDSLAKMTLTSAGELMIGKTSSPNGRLDVQGTFAMSGSTSGSVRFAVPAAAGNAIYTWPAAAPGSNMVLQSDSSGVLSWVAGGGGGGTPGGSTTQIQFNNAGAFAGASEFVWNNSTKALTVTGDINYTGVLTDTSDRRLKRDIAAIEPALPKIRKMKMYSYLMRNDPNNRREYGVMAQDMMEVIPELVRPIDDTYYGVNYVGLTAWTLQAIQELDAENTKLREENRALAAQLQELKAQQEVQARQIQSIMEKMGAK